MYFLFVDRRERRGRKSEVSEKKGNAIELHTGTKVDNYYQILLHAYYIRNWDCLYGKCGSLIIYACLKSP